MIRFLAFVLVVFPDFFLAKGQNLVPNHSFEDFELCPRTYTIEGEKIKLPFWYSPTKATPDYFNSCSKFSVSVPVNFMGHQWAKDGQAYVGLVLYEHPQEENKRSKEYREYVQAELYSPLLKDSVYVVDFYYSLAPYSTFAVNQLALCLSQKKLKGKFKTIKPGNILIKADTSRIDTAVGEWVRVSSIVTVAGGEKYLTIGNFTDDEHVRYKKLDVSHLRRSLQKSIVENGFAYYYIDLVGVKQYSDEQ